MASDFRITYDINEARHRIYVRVRGPHSGTELVQAMAELAKEVDDFLSYDRIIDLRDAEGFSEFDEIARRVKTLPHMEGPRGRTALVSHNPFDKAHVSSLADHLPPDLYRTFATLDEAIDWLDA